MVTLHWLIQRKFRSYLTLSFLMADMCNLDANLGGSYFKLSCILIEVIV